jgi:hypothetical protein
MKRLETRQHLIVYCDVCGKECGCSYTTFNRDTESEAHACDRLDDQGCKACNLEIQRRQLEQALARRSSNTTDDRLKVRSI